MVVVLVLSVNNIVWNEVSRETNEKSQRRRESNSMAGYGGVIQNFKKLQENLICFHTAKKKQTAYRDECEIC